MAQLHRGLHRAGLSGEISGEISGLELGLFQSHGGTPNSWMIYVRAKSHRSKWMRTGGTPILGNLHMIFSKKKRGVSQCFYGMIIGFHHEKSEISP